MPKIIEMAPVTMAVPWPGASRGAVEEALLASCCCAVCCGAAGCCSPDAGVVVVVVAGASPGSARHTNCCCLRAGMMGSGVMLLFSLTALLVAAARWERPRMVLCTAAAPIFCGGVFRRVCWMEERCGCGVGGGMGCEKLNATHIQPMQAFNSAVFVLNPCWG